MAGAGTKELPDLSFANGHLTSEQETPGDFPTFLRDRVAELVYSLAMERERSLWQELEDHLSNVHSTQLTTEISRQFTTEISRPFSTERSRTAGVASPSRQISRGGADVGPSRQLSPFVVSESPVRMTSRRNSSNDLPAVKQASLASQCQVPHLVSESTLRVLSHRNSSNEVPAMRQSSLVSQCQVRQNSLTSLASSVETSRNVHETQDIDADTRLKFRPQLEQILVERDSQKRNGFRGVRTGGGILDSQTRSWTASVAAMRLQNPGRKRECLFHPDGQLHVITELCTILALLHDSIVIPFVMAWNIDDSLGISIGMMVSLSIWTVDIAMNFTTGYYKSDGEVEMGRYRAACRYLRSTFIIDLSIAGLDWFSRITEWILGGSARGGSMAVLRLARIARLGRLVRILNFPRLLKLYSRFLSTRGAALSTAWTVVFQAFQILAGILWINHFSSCVWFAIGRLSKEGGLESDTGEAWLDINVGTLDITYYQVGTLFQYTTCMHWSMTQMTPGSMAVTPRNSYERLWNIVCLVFGLLFGTSLVGQLSSKMVQFNMSRQVEMRRMDVLRRLLRENAVSAELSGRVQRRILNHMNVKTRLCEQDVEDLKHLPSNLRTLLRHTMYVQHFLRHPLFAAWQLQDPNMIMFVCSTGGLAFECVSAGDECFSPGVESDRAYLILDGAMGYACTDTESPSQKPSDGDEEAAKAVVKDVVGQGFWICEIALWFEWHCLGSLEAQSPCEMMSVTTGAIAFGLKHCSTKVEELTLQWANAIAKHASMVQNGFHHGGQQVGSSLELMLNFGAVALNMSLDARVLLAQCALDVTSQQRPANFLRTKSLKKLDEEAEGEVEEGKSVLCIDGAGMLVRTVPLVVLRITRQDRRALVMLAHGFNIGSRSMTNATSETTRGTSEQTQSGAFFWQPVCKLPGKKVRVGEDPVAVVKSYIELEMPNCHHLIERVSDTAVSTDVRVMPSTTYQIKSYYHRTIIDIVLDGTQETILAEKMNDFEADFLEYVPVLSGMDIQISEGVDGSAQLYSWLLPEELGRMENGMTPELIDAIRGLNVRRYVSSGVTSGIRSKELSSMGSLRRARSTASELTIPPPPPPLSSEGTAVGGQIEVQQLLVEATSPRRSSNDLCSSLQGSDVSDSQQKQDKKFLASEVGSLEQPDGDGDDSGDVSRAPEVKTGTRMRTRVYANV